MKENEFTTIQITKKVKERLKERGKMGESYNKVVERLLNKKRKDEKNESKR